jgi:hypothetical protein
MLARVVTARICIREMHGSNFIWDTLFSKNFEIFLSSHMQMSREDIPQIMPELKDAVFWNVEPCGSPKNRRFGGTCSLHLRSRTRTSSVRRLKTV